MTIERGLKPAIIQFTSLEQKIIVKVAEKLENNGFPVSQLTRVHLKKRIVDNKDYYSYNEITFCINPGVYKQDEFNWGIENIGVGWDDPAVTRTPDGGIEFEAGIEVKFEDLVMCLYRLNDTYSYGELLKNNDEILRRINDVLIINNSEDTKYFTTQGILELIKNYLIVITGDQENKEVFQMEIRRIDHNLIDFKHFNELFEQYHLKIDLTSATVEVLKSFDPTFFPNPVPNPPKPII